MEETNVNRTVNEEHVPVKGRGVKRDVRIFRHRQFEIIEVNKETIDNIKEAVDRANKDINNGTILSDILLGLSTTLFGGVIGFVPNIVEMLSSNQLTPIIFFYFAMLLASVILFAVYLHVQRKSYSTSIALINAIKRESDSISKSFVIPENEFPETLPSCTSSKPPRNESDMKEKENACPQ